MGIENNGTLGRTTRFSMHAKTFKRVKLLLLSTMSKRPSRESLQLPTSEGAQSALFRGNRLRGERRDQDIEFIVGQSGQVEWADHRVRDGDDGHWAARQQEPSCASPRRNEHEMQS